MSDDVSEAVDIYDHKHVSQIIVHPDGKRCITVSGNLMKMFSLPSHEHLMDFQGTEFYIEAAALFDDDTLMAYTSLSYASDAKIVFWSLSNGAISLRCNERKVKHVLSDVPISIVPLRPNQFMVIGNQETRIGTTGGKAIAYMLKKRSPELPINDSATLRVVSTSNSFQEFNDICSHANRFVVNAWYVNTMQVWAWESDEFQCVKELDVSFQARSVALSDKYIVCSDRNTVQTGEGNFHLVQNIHIYSSSTMDLIRKFTSPFSIGILEAICNDNLLVSGCREDENTVAILGMDCGDMLWKGTFLTKISCCQLSVSKEFGAQAIVGTRAGEVWKCPLSPDIASKLMQSDSSGVSVLPPLQNALSRCLAGAASPAKYSDSLITFSACSASFPEWCSAHQLIVLAVRNGDIDGSSEHKGNIAHWFENLYLAVKELDLSSDEDLVVAKRYLREAKRMGLIEGIEAVLAALHVTRQVREEVRALHRAGILILEQVMRIEKRFDMLKESCEQYRRHQMYSQCIGIALQIIPIVGGASAGVISAGANIVEGLSIKDVADYAFGLGSSMTEGEMPSLGDRIFRHAAEVLSPESVAKVREEELRLVEEAVSACELSLEELRRLFIERAKEGCETVADEEGVIKEDEAESAEETELLPAVQNMTLPVHTASEAGGPTPEKRNFEGIASSKPSELKSFDLQRSVIRGLNQREIATLWAAFIVRFDDNSLDGFLRLRDRILLVLEANELDGVVLVDRDGISSWKLAKAIVDGLKNDGKGELTIGAGVKVKQFINAII